jgi:DNA-binding NtrC family response regulator
MVEVLMKIESILGLPEGLEIGSFDVTAQMITLTVVSTQQKSRATPLSNAQSKQPPKLGPKEAELSQAKREERLARYLHVVALRKQGFSQTAIASQVGIGHATVSRWLSSGTFPEQQPRPRKMALDPYLPFLRQ